MSEQNSYLVFSLSDEWLAIDVHHVTEIIEIIPLEPVPNTQNFFKGLINLRGKVIGIIDLAECLHLEMEYSESSRIVLIEFDSQIIGVLVSEIIMVTSLNQTQNSNVELKIPQKYFLSMSFIQNKIINIIDIVKLLKTENFIQVNQSNFKYLNSFNSDNLDNKSGGEIW